MPFGTRSAVSIKLKLYNEIAECVPNACVVPEPGNNFVVSHDLCTGSLADDDNGAQRIFGSFQLIKVNN